MSKLSLQRSCSGEITIFSVLIIIILLRRLSGDTEYK
ncbi:hypothetical protein ECP03047993_5459, partial [Escherichia coli P0304799.3]